MMKLCICADPENCTEIPEGWICKRLVGKRSVPKPGIPHIAFQCGEWRVIVHKDVPPWSLSAMALAHVDRMNIQRITGITSYHRGV